MPLSVSFLFHFNQGLTSYAKVADLSCYRGLLKTLRKQKGSRFPIHVSGTLLESLVRYSPETLRLMQEGVREGQFELLGSTYSQNIMASTDDASNKIQMEMHLEALRKFFKVRPRGFWVAERCWKQSFVKLLSDFGYKYTAVEKQTLEKSRTSNVYLAHKTSHGGASLEIVNDDEPFKHKVNLSVWAGKEFFRPALDHLKSLSGTADSGKSLVLYAEDAEASGLWGYHLGVYPQPVWKNWNLLFKSISQTGSVKICSIEDFLESGSYREKIGTIPDGQAEWMVASLGRKGAPYHEDGYKDWFDFNRRSPKIRKYRSLYEDISRRIIESEDRFSRFKNGNGNKKICALLEGLLSQAKLTLCRHQYEFGCIGIGRYNYGPFEGARKCEIPLNQFDALIRKKINGASAPLKLPHEPGISWGDEIASPGWIEDHPDKSWEKFARKIPLKNAWFTNYIAEWVFKGLPEKTVEFRRESPRIVKEINSAC